MVLGLKLALLIVASYFLGSVPFGLIVGLSKGIDPRKAGSGNIGATNLGRLLGGKYFSIVFTLDLLKSFVPMLLAGWLLHRAGVLAGVESTRYYLLWLLVGFASVIGHMFSIFLKFKGGKGVATSAGLMLGLYPYYTLPAVAAILTWGAVFMIWRYVSLASMCGAVVFPLAYLAVGLAKRWPVFGQQMPLLLFGLLVAGLVVYKHRSNIARLRAGTEKAFRKQTSVVSH